MRPDRRGRTGGGAAALSLLLILAPQAPDRPGEDPAELLARAARVEGQARRRLAREALRLLAGSGREQPLLAARAFAFLGAPEQGEEVLSRAGEGERQGAPWAAAAAALAQAYLEKGRPEAALRLLAPLPEEGVATLRLKAWSRLGHDRLAAGRREEGLPAALRALQGGVRDLSLAGLVHRACVALAGEGRLAEALAGFQVLAGAFPEEPWPTLNLALALRQAGRYDESDRVLAAAAVRWPGSAEVENERGLLAKARRLPAQAEACFREALRRDPASSSARTNLALHLLRQGRREEAQELLGQEIAKPAAPLLSSLLWLRSGFCHKQEPL